MGNSLQDYRIQIGLFGGSSYSFKSRKVNHSGNRNKSDKLNINPLLCLLILLLCSVVCQAAAQNRTNQENRTKYIYRRPHPLTYQYLSKSSKLTDFNFLARYTNGNGRSRNGLKMAHINLGGGFLINRTNEIEQIIGDYKPHILEYRRLDLSIIIVWKM